MKHHIKFLLLASMFLFAACRQSTETTLIPSDSTRTPDQLDTARGEWHELKSQFIGDGLCALEFIGPSVGFGSTDEGDMYKSTDSGTTWIHLAKVYPKSIWALHFFDSTEGICCGNPENVMFRTTDGGHTWKETPAVPTVSFHGIKFFNRSLGFALNLTTTAGGIIRSTDAGLTWRTVLPIPEASLRTIDCLDSNNWIAAGGGSILVSHDAGSSWKRVTGGLGKGAQIYGVKFVGRNTAIIVGGEAPDPIAGYVLRSTDLGETWSKVLSANNFIQAIATNKKGLITAAGLGGNIWDSKDDGRTWDHATLGNANWMAIDYASSSRVVVASGFGVVAVRDNLHK